MNVMSFPVFFLLPPDKMINLKFKQTKQTFSQMLLDIFYCSFEKK